MISEFDNTQSDIDKFQKKFHRVIKSEVHDFCEDAGKNIGSQYWELIEPWIKSLGVDVFDWIYPGEKTPKRYRKKYGGWDWTSSSVPWPWSDDLWSHVDETVFTPGFAPSDEYPDPIDPPKPSFEADPGVGLGHIPKLAILYKYALKGDQSTHSHFREYKKEWMDLFDVSPKLTWKDGRGRMIRLGCETWYSRGFEVPDDPWGDDIRKLWGEGSVLDVMKGEAGVALKLDILF